MYKDVYTLAYIYICMYISANTCIYICMYVSANTHACIHIHACIYIQEQQSY